MEHALNHSIVSTARRTLLSFPLLGLVVAESSAANAAVLWFDSGSDRRQLELCLVTVLRVAYWAETVAQNLAAATSRGDDAAAAKAWYLEARLGAKAALTGRVGGGANGRVYALSTLQLKPSLDDAVWYAAKDDDDDKQKVQDWKRDLLESLAAVVEFDGLETTQDPSPRSSLMLSMYNREKAQFVQRMLSERVVPTARAFCNAYGPTVLSTVESYIQSTYPNEVPPKKQNVATEPTTQTENPSSTV